MREGLAQPRAWSEGDMSAEHCLQCEAGELAVATRTRQARRLSACTAQGAMGQKLRYPVVAVVKAPGLYWGLVGGRPAGVALGV